MNSDPSKSDRSELDWLAFCYAAGDLSPEETAAFDERLAEDQSAREALARAVELTQVVASAQSLAPVTLARPQSAVWTKRLTWMAIGSAASLLVVLVWGGSSSWFAGDRAGLPTMVASAVSAELAAAWSQTRQELADSDSDLWFPTHLAAEGNVAESGTADAVDSPSGLAGDAEYLETVTPDWMTAALESYPNEPADPDSTPFDGERSEN